MFTTCVFCLDYTSQLPDSTLHGNPSTIIHSTFFKSSPTLPQFVAYGFGDHKHVVVFGYEKLDRKEENKKKPKVFYPRRNKKQMMEDAKKGKKRSRRRKSDDTSDEESESSRSNSPAPAPVPEQPSVTPTVIQPIYFIVNPENVNTVVNTIQKALLNPADINLNEIGRESDIQIGNPLRFMEEEEHIPTIQNVPTSTSFATQYDPEPTYCERGTMMTEEPLNYFDPPYGAEFGDMTPRQKNGSFDFSSSSQQPQTRSFGTMFENVTTCNTGTSMIDESFDSEFLRDIETQTPSYMIQQQQPQMDQTSASTSCNDWPWRMTDGDI